MLPFLYATWDIKDLDIAIFKATNHVEYPPKKRHVRKIFTAVPISRPRADVSYCIHALSRRSGKTRNWIVAIKTLIVIHLALREGDPSFREELLHYSKRGHLFQISNFKDDSSPLGVLMFRMAQFTIDDSVSPMLGAPRESPDALNKDIYSKAKQQYLRSRDVLSPGLHLASAAEQHDLMVETSFIIQYYLKPDDNLC